MPPIPPALRASRFAAASLFGCGLFALVVLAPVLLVSSLLVSSLLVAGPARAEFSLFGSAERTPANPFASNYASPPVRGSTNRPRRVRRNAPAEAPRPPRDIPR